MKRVGLLAGSSLGFDQLIVSTIVLVRPCFLEVVVLLTQLHTYWIHEEELS